MSSNFVLRHSDNRLSVFYFENDSIFSKTFKDNSWGNDKVIISNVRQNFTFTTWKNNTYYLFCQDLSGNIILCHFKENAWENKIILENNSTRINIVVFYPIITDNSITLIYNVPSPEPNDSNQYLISQKLNENGGWSQATKIDSFLPMQGSFFQIQRVSETHLIAFYQTRTTEYNLGYREISATTHGKFNPFHTTTYQIIDQSFLTTESEIHLLYIVKSMFSNQLIYRKKNSDGITNPIVISEGQKLRNCMIFYISGNLFISYNSGDRLYLSKSVDNGNTFKRPYIFDGKIAKDLIKVNFISQTPQDKNAMFSHEVYVNKNNPRDIQLFPLLYNDFFPAKIKLNKQNVEHQQNHAYEKTLEELQEKNTILENQLLQKERELIAKNEQITQMAKHKNESEKMPQQRNFMEKPTPPAPELMEESQRENFILKRENEKLSDKIMDMEDEINNIKGQLLKIKSENKPLTIITPPSE